MEEKIRISMLLQIYGKLLTQKQFEFMDYYYNEDLSLSEIAENNEITRQAVREILSKSKKKEQTIKDMLKELEQTDINTKQKNIIEKIKNALDI